VTGGEVVYAVVDSDLCAVHLAMNQGQRSTWAGCRMPSTSLKLPAGVFGDLLALVATTEPAFVAELDPETLEVLQVVELDLGGATEAWDLAPLYCDDCDTPTFLVYSSLAGVTVVTHVRMDPPYVSTQGSLPGVVVEAGPGVCPP
jgi:hypothetical protein